MDDQLDNDLRDHIKEVFDNYEDTTADDGWLLLREKFPAQAKRRGIAWIWWAAAALLICSGIGLWIKVSTIDKPVNHIVKKVNKAPKQGPQPVQKVVPDTSALNNIALKAARKSSQRYIAVAPKSVSKTNSGANQPAAGSENTNPDAGKTPANANPATLVTGAVPANTNAAAVVQIPKIAGKSPDQTSNTPAIAPAAATATNANTIAAQQPKPPKNIMDMFKNDKGDKQAAKKDDDQNGKKVHFGLYAGTYFNYSKGSDNQMNVGGGITSDIKLNHKLKLVTGITVGQNSLSYQAIPAPAASFSGNFAAPTAIAVAGDTYKALASTPTIKNYNATLVGLDIPVNLKYEFNPDKTDAYMSIGLSSGTFIDESYTYKYNYPSFQSSSLKQTQNETTGNNFNSFYFAKTLNVAFGIGYPFGKNRLVIEPFLKYPLDGLGSQNLKFGAGGLNLKFNFLSSHK